MVKGGATDIDGMTLHPAFGFSSLLPLNFGGCCTEVINMFIPHFCIRIDSAKRFGGAFGERDR